MINRLTYNIKSLPPGEQEQDIISYLEAQANYGELTLHASADHATISLSIPRLYIYQYKEFLVDVIPLNGQVYITCHKITPALLVEKHQQIREKLAVLNTYLRDFEKELTLQQYQARRETKARMEEQMRSLKREIKLELIKLEVKAGPETALGKLLK